MSRKSLPAHASQFDTATPLLLVKVGQYPQHHGGLALARSMGRVGIRVVAMVEQPYTPLAVSRHVSKRVPGLSPDAGEREVVASLASAASALGRRPVAAATDDEAAVLLDEHRPALAEHVRLPRQQPGLARLVSSKSGLAEICTKFGVASPSTCSAESLPQLVAWAEDAVFPIVLKNMESFSRLLLPAVSATTIIATRTELHRWAERIEQWVPVVAQEYVPAEARENLIYQAYRASNTESIISFTGVKLRDWPVGRGETTLSMSRPDPRLKEIGDRLLTSLNYRGVCGFDVIHDRRDGQYKLIDFNPRFGANSATFVMDNGIDLIRAYHLDLTGRPIPEGHQVDGRVFQVEPGDKRARRASPNTVGPAPSVRAFRAADDPLPAIVAAAARAYRSARSTVAGVVKERLRGR